MNTKTTEEADTAQVTRAHKATASKKAGGARKRAHVAPRKSKLAPKAHPVGKAPRGAEKTTAIRDGSKASSVLDLLKRADGATLAELMKATGWQAHSVRGFLSGTVRKKLGLAITSAKVEDDERTYSIKA